MKRNRTTALAMMAALATVLAGCGKKVEEAVTAASVTISGTLSGATLSTLQSEYSDLAGLGILEDSSHIFAVTDYSVRCVTLSGTPQAGEGTCDSSGNFSLSLASATNVPIGCFIMKAGTIAAIVAFQSTTTGMDGNPTREGAYVAGDGASGLSFGTVSVDLSTGKATVTKTNVVQTGGSTPTTTTGAFADMTGDWTIKIPSSTPSGYTAVCPAGTPQNDCDGPMDGQTIHLRHYKALDASSGAHYGMSIWDSSSAFTACTLGGGGEGADLPGTWTAQNYGTTTAAQLINPVSITHGFPAPTGLSIPHPGFCGASPSLTTCDQITSPGWGFDTAGECQFYCAMNSLWNTPYGGCMGDLDIDWGSGTFSTALNATNTTYSGSAWTGITANTSNSDYVSYLNGSVKFRKKPRQRFMFNELVVLGSVGTLLDEETRNQTICVDSNSDGSCESNPTCTIIRNNKLTITQTSTTTADVELIQKVALAPGANAACSTDQFVSRELERGEQKWFFKLQK